MILQGKKVTLRPIEEADLEYVRGMLNDPWMESRIEGWAWPVSRKQEELWFANYRNSDSMVRYIVETEGSPGGFTGLKKIDWKNGHATISGMRITDRGKGLATDAYMTLLKYAFGELRLNRINNSALAFNQASLKSILKVGFKQEGIARAAVFKGGQYHDRILFGCLKSDYEALCDSTGYWN